LNLKKAWISFYNIETAELMEMYESNPFIVNRNMVAHTFAEVADETGIDISAQTLRSVFAREMSKAEDIGKILTRERLRLLQIIREKRPESISELARMLKRKESNVHNDLTFLEGMGLLELKQGKNHIRKVPVVDYDALHITVPLTA
jgi:predicted transcriptional regulator